MFRITALPYTSFEPLFGLTDAQLAVRQARRMVADTNPGFPCRVSLRDATPGETVILAHYLHQPVDTPFRASHAIYIRQGAEQARPSADKVPVLLRSRVLSLRGFDDAGMMRAADLTEGSEVEGRLERMLAEPAIAYAHIHYAKLGCYAARADRA